MQITRLSIQGLRNIEQMELQTSQHINLIVGENGSGKTSILESIYVLGTGKSFRESTLALIIQSGASQTTLFTIVEHDGVEKRLGVAKGRHHCSIKINGDKIYNNAALAACLPLQLIHPDSQKLINGGPAQKRKFLDWGVFHVEQSYSNTWKEFRKLLRQRNSALQQGLNSTLIQVWDEPLAVAAQAIHVMRQRYIDGFRTHVQHAIEQLTGFENIELHYYPGWNQQESLLAQLTACLRKDLRMQYTTVGPQRADLPVSMAGVAAEKWFSRGEQKLIAAAFLLAQQTYLSEIGNKDCILLVDDLPAELDAGNRAKFLQMVQDNQSQTFITATCRNLLNIDTEYKLFHVKQGELEK